MSHPGITVSTILEHANESDLKRILGKKTLDLLVLLDSSLAKGNELNEVAKQLVDPLDAINYKSTRQQLIHLLPIEKAHELADRLLLQKSNNIYNDLIEHSNKPQNLETIQKFFGAVPEERAPELIRPSVETIKPNYPLFLHQLDAAHRVREQLYHLPHKVVLHMPTGAGKTRTAMHVVANHLKSKGPTLVCWFAYNSELLDQAAEAFEEAWSNLGDRPLQLVRFWGDRSPALDKVDDGIIIAGLGKMYAAYNKDTTILQKLGDRATLTVVDEAHQAIAPTHRWVTEGIHTKQPKNALLGLTATPGRTWTDINEDRQLSDFFENSKVTLRVEGYNDPVSFLIREGYLAKPDFRSLESTSEIAFEQQEKSSISEEDEIPNFVLEKLGEDEHRNVMIIRELETMMHKHNRILLFAASVDQAKLISSVLSARGYKSDVVTGETPKGKRQRIIRRFRSNDPQPIVLSNYGVLTTGFDAPNASAALIARPTRSLVLYSQMVGRATRGPKVGGNERAEIVTVVDTKLPGFGSVVEAFHNWEDIWNEHE